MDFPFGHARCRPRFPPEGHDGAGMPAGLRVRLPAMPPVPWTPRRARSIPVHVRERPVELPGCSSCGEGVFRRTKELRPFKLEVKRRQSLGSFNISPRRSSSPVTGRIGPPTLPQRRSPLHVHLPIKLHDFPDQLRRRPIQLPRILPKILVNGLGYMDRDGLHASMVMYECHGIKAGRDGFTTGSVNGIVHYRLAPVRIGVRS